MLNGCVLRDNTREGPAGEVSDDEIGRGISHGDIHLFGIEGTHLPGDFPGFNGHGRQSTVTQVSLVFRLREIIGDPTAF
jgi:hypothetical protein